MKKGKTSIQDDIVFGRDFGEREFIEDFRQELQKSKKELNFPEKPRLLRL